MLAVTAVFAGIFGEGKYWDSGCAFPSTVKLVTIAGTPAVSRKVKLVCQLSPCESGPDGHTKLGHEGTIAEALVGATMVRVRVAPVPLKVPSPAYCAVRTKFPGPS